MGLAPLCEGLGHAEAQKYRIYVFPGAKVPFVLRFAGERHISGVGVRFCYELVGACYLHGFMDGAAMVNFDTHRETVYLI
ncbi:hypothetical protein F5Y15DRAFT_367098 [Xylariaceae sp. FL0016]|nr:hypothetical protein F5Y15DRAFT_367098 [Xylariaceae sp. FL0016]